MITLGQGFRPYLLNHIKSVVGMGATPQFKLELTGFLNMLMSFNRPEILRLDNTAGHQNTVQIAYKQRYTKQFTGTSEADACNNTNIEARKEIAVDLTSYRDIALYLEDETIARYEDDASKTVMLGQPPTAFMNEMLDEIYRATSAIMEGVNEDLMTTFSANFGVNRVTGNNATKAININKDGTVNDLANGINEIMSDYMINLMSGKPSVFGSGLLNNYFLQQAAKSYNQSGVNTSIESLGMKFFYDQQAATILGANQVGVVEPNSVQMVEYLRYTGFKAGVKPGGSTFGVIPLPVQNGTTMSKVLFDFLSLIHI